MRNPVELIDKYMRYSFYALFFITPLVMWRSTYELFEFNKMWFVFGLTLFIALLWGSKMIIQGRFFVRRTPFDIPLILFLLSQIISTFLSIDPHVSFWGYYSRFNGGLASIFSYVLLYYAFASNFIRTNSEENTGQKLSYNMILASLGAGVLVFLWGFPSHFGYDPTCLVFRGALDVSCWTESFQPKVRIFSTLGQPNWLAAHLAVLIPISLAFGITKLRDTETRLKKYSVENVKNYVGQKSFLFAAFYLLFAVLLYLSILWTSSQSGFLGVWAGIIFFLGLLKLSILRQKKNLKALWTNPGLRFLGASVILFLLTTFFIGAPNPRLNAFTLKGLKQTSAPAASTPNAQPTDPNSGNNPAPTAEFGGTDSGEIRLIVWRGAIEIFKQYPLFGSGVETYAYAYYKARPIEHNLTSEWDFLYNKAHNEYLNYLATTGAAGLGTYLLFIGWFGFVVIKSALKRKTAQHPYFFIAAGLAGGFVSILVTNFFGFSVVTVNLFFFLIPLFFVMLLHENFKEVTVPPHADAREVLTPTKKIGIAILIMFFLYFLLMLYSYWRADKNYALGYNFNRVGEYVQASPYLMEAYEVRPSEPLFADELSVNLATLSLLYAQQGQGTQAAQLADQAVQLSNGVAEKSPNNVVFFKTRTRVFYLLAQLDPKYLPEALRAIEHARELAPTDAKVMYNQALLYDQAGQRQKAIDVLRQAIKIKPDYRDAYYALGLFYTQMAEEQELANPTQSQEHKATARRHLEYIINTLGARNDQQTLDLLKSLDE